MKTYGDGGFYFVQPINSPRQVVSTYGDGGFYFVQPVTSPRQVVSTYGAVGFHRRNGLDFGAAGKKGGSAVIGDKIRVADASGKIVEYPCPRPGVTYDPKLDPCGEKPWFMSQGEWNTYRRTGKTGAAKNESKCADLLAKYNAAKHPIVKSTLKTALLAAGCSLPRPGTGISASPPGGNSDTVDDVDKEEANLDLDTEESFLQKYGVYLGIGAGVLLLGTGAALFFRKPAQRAK